MKPLTPPTSRQAQAVIAYAHRHGHTIDWTHNESITPLWTPDNTFHLDPHSYNEHGEALFHELAHWWQATPQQRQHPDFGLGPHANYAHPDPTQPDATHRRIISRELLWQQEETACHLMLLAPNIVGHTPWGQTIDDHQAAHEFGAAPTQLGWDTPLRHIATDMSDTPPTRHTWQQTVDAITTICDNTNFHY